MDSTQLVQAMYTIAHRLGINLPYDIRKSVFENVNGIPFLWMLHENGMYLYLFNDCNWGNKFINKMNLLEQTEEDKLLYYFDGLQFVPIFPKVATQMAIDQKRTGQISTKGISSLQVDYAINDYTNNNAYERKY